MANLLDEVTGKSNPAGRETFVIDKQLPVKVGFGSVLFEIALWITIPLFVLLFVYMSGEAILPYRNYILIGGVLVGILPGIIFLFMKVSAHNYFQQLEQRIQGEASNIDNFLEQRVQVLQNVVGLLEKAIDLDKDVLKSVAALRSGIVNDANRSQVNGAINTTFNHLMPHVEAYPELRAHAVIEDAMQQNSYLQKEITAARVVYNNRVTQWNTDIYRWPTKMIVAAREGYTTRIPFSVSDDVKEMAKSKFF